MPRFAYELVGAAGLFVVAALAFKSLPLDRTRFSLAAGIGSAYLGLDELFDLHVQLGRALYEDFGWGDPPLVNHWDDLLVGLVGLAGVAVAAVFWREIVRGRQFAVLFGFAVACFAAAIAWDASVDPSRTFNWWAEETLELVGAGAMVVAFWWRKGWLAAETRAVDRS